jgi:hypothetical protein
MRSRWPGQQSLIVAARIDRQQTKIAAETTNRYRVAKPVEKLASMICTGPHAFLTAVPMFGIATSAASRKMPPMMNAPITENRTALGAARRGSRVSSASVEGFPRNSTPSLTRPKAWPPGRAPSVSCPAG